MIPRFDTLSELKLNKEMQKEARKYIQKLKEVIIKNNKNLKGTQQMGRNK